MIDRNVTNIKTQAKYEGSFTILKDLIQNGQITATRDKLLWLILNRLAKNNSIDYYFILF